MKFNCIALLLLWSAGLPILSAQQLFGERTLILDGHPTASFGYFAHFGQVDGSGPQDLLTNSASTIIAASLEVFLNNDTSTPFSDDPAFVIDQGISFYYFGVADMNGDGFDDVLTDAGIYFWDSDDSTYDFQAFFADQNLFCLAHSDINDDGAPDVVLRDGNSLYCTLNQGDGSFGELTLLTDDNSSDSTIPNPVIGDFSGDDRVDILVYPTYFNQDFKLYLQQEDGSFVSTVLPLSREQLNGGFSPAVASVMKGVDYDSDGDLDIIYEHADGIYMIVNEGAVTFESVDTLQVKSQESRQQYHDLNLDGVTDAVKTSYNNSNLNITLRDEDGTTIESFTLSGGAYNTLINPILTDYDLDGDLDLVEFAFEENTQRLYLRLNNTIEAPNNTTIQTRATVAHRIWPNPVQDQFSFQVEDETFTNGTLVVFDQAGNLLFQTAIKQGKNHLTLPSNIPSGQLLYRIQNEQDIVVATGKLICL